MEELASQVYKHSMVKGAQDDPIPQRPYNINQHYFLHIDQTVPFDLDQVYFTAHIREDGIYFKILKQKGIGRPEVSQQPDDQTEGLHHHV